MRTEICPGCSRIDTRHVTLRDGTVVCNECPAYLYECEVRYVAELKSNDYRAAYLGLVAKARGKEAADRLRNDTWSLMRR